MEICSVKLFVNLGFAIHPEKWVFTSFQEIEFLGFINNLAVIKIKLTTEKKNLWSLPESISERIYLV